MAKSIVETREITIAGAAPPIIVQQLTSDTATRGFPVGSRHGSIPLERLLDPPPFDRLTFQS